MTAVAPSATPHAAGRAVEPRAQGYLDRDGVRIFYELFGDAPETILFLPPWAINHSRFWKGQVPYLSRHFSVLTFDPRGNGRSDRPESPDEYGAEITAADALALLDELGLDRVLLIVHCGSADKGLLLTAHHPERFVGAAFMSPALPITPPRPERVMSFTEPLATDEGWAKQNRHYWQRDYPGFLDFFFGRCFTEPHSTKQIEDGIGWGLETTPETLELTVRPSGFDEATSHELMSEVRCPVLVIQGDEDALIPADRGAAFAAATGGRLVTLEGAGHGPHARDPVRFNLLLSDFANSCWRRPREPQTWRRAVTRSKRALYISSPIGLGHAWRDLAIVQELRRLQPGLTVDWLAQDPVTRVLEAAGERIHSASRHLANESRHIEAESDGHRLHAFEAIRRMDEILLANFMVFHEVTRSEQYDLWIGDEAWEVDYFLHENPELKSAPYCWLTDFVGWLPMPASGERDARLTADYNAEMIEQIARFPHVRDRSIFIGEPDDVVPDSFGPGLPLIRDWVGEQFQFSGYVTPAARQVDRAAIRAELGYAEDERVCIVAVGGSGVGIDLLQRVLASYSAAKTRIPALRMVVVCGPRIDPSSLSAPEGVEVQQYVHELYRHLAVCDVAVVQGGLTTSMELVAAKTPFLYFPLRDHFEQNFHVRHRLTRYGANRCLDIDTADPDTIAEAIAAALSEPVEYQDVAPGGATRAAELIAELL
jgi:pimeloyl-ACP methyl ester carboxylesterase/predicted glycosyltransferase